MNLEEGSVGENTWQGWGSSVGHRLRIDPSLRSDGAQDMLQPDRRNVLKYVGWIGGVSC